MSTKSWAMSHGIAIVAIIFGAWVVRRFSKFFIKKVVHRTLTLTEDKQLSTTAVKKREDTLVGVFAGTVRVVIWIVAGAMILSESGIDIKPLLATAGVAGLALGFGGQYLIRDIISGLFILLENQFRVGDVVCIDGTCGLVEGITLRMTTLRDLDGTVHHLPNGEVKKTSNLSKQFSRVNLDIGVSYKTDIDHLKKTVNRVGKDLAEDPEWREFIKKAPEFVRINDFADSAIVFKVLGDTEPMKQWDVAGELRRRLKIEFEKEGIEIPFPQLVVHSEKS